MLTSAPAPLVERKQSLWIVIPAYNAATTLPTVLVRIPDQVWAVQPTVLVVNDGSTDDTVATIRRLQARYGRSLQVLEKSGNEGYARAQKSGFQYALDHGAAIAVLLHADGQYPPEQMPRLLEPLQAGRADLVMGSRMASKWDALRGGMPIYKWLANVLLSRLENAVYGLRFSEYHSGYMLYSRQALERIPFHRLSDTFHFDGEMLMVGAKRGLRVCELAIPTTYQGEKSYLKPIPYGFAVLKILWDYTRGKYQFDDSLPTKL